MGVDGREMRQICASSKQEFMAKGKQLMVAEQSQEWDLNQWKWDSNLFIAKPSNISPSGCRNHPCLPNGCLSNGCSACSDSIIENGGALEKHRKVLMLEEEEFAQGDASLTLKLGGSFYTNAEMGGGNCEGSNGKRLKTQLGLSNRPCCQVDSCNADLSDARDYHKRHKVCEMHAKSPIVLLDGVVQRFCQQCSRFHVLQEFDEEKRSCRRRLAGHNRRRRKTNLDAIIDGRSLKDEHAKRYLLVSILRILSNLHSNNSDQTIDQDLLLQLLGLLAGSGATSAPINLSGDVESLQPPQNDTKSGPAFPSNSLCGVTAPEPASSPFSVIAGFSHISSKDPSSMISGPSASTNITMPLPEQKSLNDFNGLCLIKEDPQRGSEARTGQVPALEAGCAWERNNSQLNDFDLNSIYTESQDYHPRRYQDSHQESPPQTSGNSESASDKSPSTSGRDVLCRTERIVFKLFGKDPSNLPHVLRAQILNWLSNSPTDIESYIRPGCIVLTIYLRLSENMWDELCRNLSSQLRKLLEVSDDFFWKSGWICAKVGNQLALIHNGQVLLDTSFLLRSEDTPMILSVTPIAVALSTDAVFTVKGMHLTCTARKLLCTFPGRQLVQEIDPGLTADRGDSTSSTDSLECLLEGNKEIQSCSFTCSFPNVAGRGFIEVEDHDLSSGFLPFIVAESDVCSELRSLESSIEIVELIPDQMKARAQVIEFLQEFGWLLERNRLASCGSDLSDPQSAGFSYFRFKWLLEFSINRDWCAVVKKLLTILFAGAVAEADCSVKRVLEEVAPLHRAVRQNCGPMVDFLLKYIPQGKTIFKPIFKVDARGLAGITPLHIAASIEGADDVLDRLTDNPDQNWAHAWENVRDESGFTPEDYARQRGHDRYTDLVRRKISEKSTKGNVILDMKTALPMQGDSAKYKEMSANFQIDSRRGAGCKLCKQQLLYRSKHRSLRYRPAILSMVTIAAVCVCVGLFWKSPPEVVFVDPPFRWEILGYGPI